VEPIDRGGKCLRQFVGQAQNLDVRLLCSVIQSCRRQRMGERLGRQDNAIRDRESGLLQHGERCRLLSHQRAVGDPDLGQPSHLFDARHGHLHVPFRQRMSVSCG
jgi:hypothetical protein